MTKRILVDASYPNETRVAVIDENCKVEEIEYETLNKHLIKGNIYLASITRIEPSLQAVFLDYDNGQSGFLSFSEIHPNYYNQNKTELPLRLMSIPKITPDDLHKDNTNSESCTNTTTDDAADDKLIDNNDTLNRVTQPLDKSQTEDIETFNKQDKVELLLHKQYNIQDVVQKGQVVLVQATKESRGNKNASFTTYISLAGKYCIITPNRANNNGISRKITNYEKRKYLKNIIDSVLQKDVDNASVIIRTSGAQRTSYEIKRDYIYLVSLWNKILDITKSHIAPAFIHIENDIIQKTIRDMHNADVQEIIIQGKVAYNSAVKFMRAILPTEVDIIKEHNSATPIFTQYNIEEQISALYKPIVSLASGGYIVINPTEALIAIDVNSGKDTSEQNIEETALKTNLEAAKEISYQIILRDLSGLIIIDFIDMLENKNRKLVEKLFKKHLAKDKAKIQIDSISTFGLLQMSRQRLRPSFLESNSAICPHCSGKGIIRAAESNAIIILRTIENEIHKMQVNIINVYAHLHSITFILNNKRAEIQAIEDKYNIQLRFHNDFQATPDSFSIEKIILPACGNKSPVYKTPLIDQAELLDSIENIEHLLLEQTNNNTSLPTHSSRSKWKRKGSRSSATSTAAKKLVAKNSPQQNNNKNTHALKDSSKTIENESTPPVKFTNARRKYKKPNSSNKVDTSSTTVSKV